MFQNEFVRRYRNIPIAKYAHFSPKNETSLVITSPQLHKEFEMLLITGGETRITANNEIFAVKSGDLFFVSPYMLHSLELPPQDSFSHICFCFDLSLLSHAALSNDLTGNQLFITQHIPADSPHNPQLKAMFLEIDGAYAHSDPYWELTVRGTLCRMFAYFMQNGLCERAFSQACDKDFCISVYRHIESHYKEKLTSATTAEALNYNQSYFCRLFRKNFLMNFSEYLNMYRLEQAKRLLNDPALSISQIAGEAGFSDLSYFTKQFRLQNGEAPQKFRKHHCDL